MNAPDTILLTITMGDPAGIGPEVIVGSWGDPLLAGVARRVVVGRVAVLQRAVELLRLDLKAVAIQDIGQLAGMGDNEIPVLEIEYPDADSAQPGVNSAIGGQAAFLAIDMATRLALAGAVDGIVTAPISKKALHMAGHTQWPGHTEMLADLCGISKTVMMLYLSPRCPLVKSPVGLGVIHTTLHMSVRDALVAISGEAIIATSRLANDFVMDMLRATGETRLPRIGIAALNPHGGEEGMFGDEEIRIIAPAVMEGIRQGLPLTGPLPCDTLMHRAADGEFDCVVAMYHDQGHIALKLLGLHHAVNVTLGLPIVRTSVAHGTAFDVAWKGTARHSSMTEAIRVASCLARIPGSQ